jgi:hypothetical protein
MIVALPGCGTPGAPSLPSLNLTVPVEDLTASRRGSEVDQEYRSHTSQARTRHPDLPARGNHSDGNLQHCG